MICQLSLLKVPVENLKELNKLEKDAGQKKILGYMLRRHGKSFDAKHDTYLMMKLTVDNRIEEKINMERRRGDKLAFCHL